MMNITVLSFPINLFTIVLSVVLFHIFLQISQPELFFISTIHLNCLQQLKTFFTKNCSQKPSFALHNQLFNHSILIQVVSCLKYKIAEASCLGAACGQARCLTYTCPNRYPSERNCRAGRRVRPYILLQH